VAEKKNADPYSGPRKREISSRYCSIKTQRNERM
jgi:hypothetical protein